jgi:Na+/glutamate symporter
MERKRVMKRRYWNERFWTPLKRWLSEDHSHLKTTIVMFVIMVTIVTVCLIINEWMGYIPFSSMYWIFPLFISCVISGVATFFIVDYMEFKRDE